MPPIPPTRRQDGSLRPSFLTSAEGRNLDAKSTSITAPETSSTTRTCTERKLGRVAMDGVCTLSIGAQHRPPTGVQF
jgi:hypothetical protein